MNEEARQILCEMMDHYGRSLSNDTRRCAELLREHCGSYKRENFLFVTALENQVVTKLRSAPAGISIPDLVQELGHQLHEEFGFDKEAASWAVETWALALKIIDFPILQDKKHYSASTLRESSKATEERGRTFDSPTDVYSSPGGRLKFPEFSVGIVKFDSNQMRASGVIEVPPAQSVELKVAEDVDDFSFLNDCDPAGLIISIDLTKTINFFNGIAKDSLHQITYRYQEIDELEESIEKYGKDDKNWSGAHWSALTNLKGLRGMILSNCHWLMSKDFEQISRIQSLELLDLNMGNAEFNWISDKCLMHIARIQKLRSLNLTGCYNISGLAAVKYLGKMKNLEYLDLSKCRKINSARMQELKDMLPRAKIMS